jgi:hypothetical protein
MDFDATSAVTERRTLTVADTAAYNEMIVAMSDEQIYGRTEAALVAASAGAAPR